VRNGLQDLLRRIPPDGRAKPGELTVKLGRSSDVWYGAAMFSYMACTAVHRKYDAAHYRRVAGELLRLRTYAAQVCLSGKHPHLGDPQAYRRRL